jgi:hypothetical protein
MDTIQLTFPISPKHASQSDSDANRPNRSPRVTSSSRRVADDKVHISQFSLRYRIDHRPKSDSEMSSLVDEPPNKKARGKSKVNPVPPLRQAPVSTHVIKSELGKNWETASNIEAPQTNFSCSL